MGKAASLDDAAVARFPGELQTLIIGKDIFQIRFLTQMRQTCLGKRALFSKVERTIHFIKFPKEGLSINLCSGNFMLQPMVFNKFLNPWAVPKLPMF